MAHPRGQPARIRLAEDGLGERPAIDQPVQQIEDMDLGGDAGLESHLHCRQHGLLVMLQAGAAPVPDGCEAALVDRGVQMLLDSSAMKLAGNADAPASEPLGIARRLLRRGRATRCCCSFTVSRRGLRCSH